MNVVDARWNDPEQVERFAARDADHRLVALLAEHPDPPALRVLDLGCAGGRNTEFLARAGFDLYALDRAPAMVARTRERVATALGRDEARRRVVVGDMLDLEVLPVDRFDLVVALGIYHQAVSEDAWYAALRETRRVAAPRGLVLVSNFAPGTVLDGEPVEPIGGTRFVYRSPRGGTLCLRPRSDLDADFRALGFQCEVPSETVVREAGATRRVTVNALYRLS